MTIGRDIRFAIRNLSRAPGYTAVVILTLALGIGASTAIFTVVNDVVLRPLDYPEPQRLVRITSELRNLGATDTGVLASEMADYQDRADLFVGVSGVLPINANVTSGGVPERVDMLLVSWNYFAVLGVAPAYGRIFGREDDVAGVANVAVVSDGFWRRRLSADPLAVGRTVVIDEDPIQVIGVMPAGFSHPGRSKENEVDVWSPAGFRNEGAAAARRSRRRLEGALARLQPGVTLEQARSQLTEYGRSVSQQFPSEYPAQNGWMPKIVPLQDDVVTGVATPMFVLLSGVGLLLLVACVNVAHLVLARATARRQEMAIRLALGATGRRLTTQLTMESAVIAAAGGGLAVLVASWTLRGVAALAPARVPRIEAVALDVTSVAVTAAISLIITAIFALVPVWQLRNAETSTALKESGPGRTTDRRAGRARSMLVAAEVAMATILLIGAGLLVRTVVGLLNVPVGFETERLMTARLTLPRPNDPSQAAYLDPARRVAFYRDAIERVARLPGVEQVAMSTQIPMGGFNPPLFFEREGDASPAAARPVIHDFRVSPGYFTTLRIAIVRGRAFTDSDRAGTEPVAIVSEAAARAFWKDRDPLGQRLRLSPDSPWLTIVGIASDVRSRRLTEPPPPILYRSLDQSSDLTLALLIRTSGATPDLFDGVAREVRAVDAGVPLYAVRPMTGLLEGAVAQRQFLMRLLVLFGSVATALALLGIYGVMAYSVSQRTREIGIRMAIGARHADVARMVMRSGLTMTAVGLVLGIAVSLALSRLIASQLFGVRASDPVTIGAVLLVMGIVSAAAAYLPARRAAQVDPVIALRAQ